MTTVTPTEVWYTYEAYIIGQDDNLPVTNIVASIDRDRTWLCEATLTLDYIDDATLALLDPRTGAQVGWWIKQWSGDPDDPTEVSRLPDIDIGNTHAQMWVREASRQHGARTVTVVLKGGESMMGDKKRIAGNAVDTAAATVADLIYWSVFDVFGGASFSFDSIVTTTSIPAGDRRKMLPKESHLDLVQPELDAIGCRIGDLWGRTWLGRVRSTVSGTVKLATYEGVPDTDPIVYEATETLSREGDWADGVLIEYKQPDGTTAYHASGLGANTKGAVFNVERAKPADNAAEEMVARTITRGYDLEVIARCRFDIDAYSLLEVHTPDTILAARIRSIEWDVAASEMTILAQLGEPEE